jgi:hypothetical protein
MSQPITLQEFHNARAVLEQTIVEMLVSFSVENQVIVTGLELELDFDSAEYGCTFICEAVSTEPKTEPRPRAA